MNTILFKELTEFSKKLIQIIPNDIHLDLEEVKVGDRPYLLKDYPDKTWGSERSITEHSGKKLVDIGPSTFLCFVCNKRFHDSECYDCSDRDSWPCEVCKDCVSWFENPIIIETNDYKLFHLGESLEKFPLIYLYFKKTNNIITMKFIPLDFKLIKSSIKIYENCQYCEIENEVVTSVVSNSGCISWACDYCIFHKVSTFVNLISVNIVKDFINSQLHPDLLEQIYRNIIDIDNLFCKDKYIKPSIENEYYIEYNDDQDIGKDVNGFIFQEFTTKDGDSEWNVTCREVNGVNKCLNLEDCFWLDSIGLDVRILPHDMVSKIKPFVSTY